MLGIGTTLGIAAQALVLIPALRRTGFHWQWRFRARPNEIGRMREVGTLAGWVLGYVIASQIGVTVIAAVGGHNTAPSPSSPTPTCCSRCPTASSSSRCSPR